jgi:hypothetical protein
MWPQIPVYFIWVNKISYLTYAFAGVVGSEFQGLTLYDPTTGLLIGVLLRAFPSRLRVMCHTNSVACECAPCTVCITCTCCGTLDEWAGMSAVLSLVMLAAMPVRVMRLTFSNAWCILATGCCAGLSLPGSSAVPHSIDNGLTVSQNLGILACMVRVAVSLKLH